MKRSHPKFPIRAAALSVPLILSGALIAAARSYTPPAAEPAGARASVDIAITEQSPLPTGRRIIVRDTGGLICVYENDVLLYKTEIPVASLPARDRADLSQGIEVDSTEALHQLLEDLGS